MRTRVLLLGVALALAVVAVPAPEGLQDASPVGSADAWDGCVRINGETWCPTYQCIREGPPCEPPIP